MTIPFSILPNSTSQQIRKILKKHHEQETCSIVFCVRHDRKVTETLTKAIGADIFEIEPKVPYTDAALNWVDKKARSTIAMNNPAS